MIHLISHINTSGFPQILGQNLGGIEGGENYHKVIEFMALTN